MTATNHALTGALIGLAIQNPLVAMPAAFLSHFVLDSIPHYLRQQDETFHVYLKFEVFFCVSIVAVLIISQPSGWLVAVFAAFAATSPDFMWAPRYFRVKAGKADTVGDNWLLRFHKKIQWYERPNGKYIEMLWFIAVVASIYLLVV